MGATIASLTFLFSIMKLQFLIMRKSPTVTFFEDRTAVDLDTIYRADSENNFQMAFAFDNYKSGLKTDPRFFKVVARVTKRTNGKKEYINYPLHTCTKENFSKFKMYSL